jgi:S-disulfanyl-L-cysteine oxidoreductase SoxD
MKKLLSVLMLAAAPLAAQTADTTMKPASAGVYTEGQAARGDTVFQKFCLSCHTPTFHSDQQFKMNWLGRPVFELFKILKTTMPEDNIGGLSDDEYTRVIAYILKLNGFPAGADSLTSDSLALKRIRIGSADGATKSP